MNVNKGMVHLEINPTEAPLLYSEVWGDLQEARSVALLLNSGSLVSPLVCCCVVPRPAGRDPLLILYFTNLYMSLVTKWMQANISPMNSVCPLMIKLLNGFDTVIDSWSYKVSSGFRNVYHTLHIIRVEVFSSHAENSLIYLFNLLQIL